MKNLKFIGLVIFALVLFSCGGKSNPSEVEESETTATESTNDLKGMEMVDLNEYDVNASIYIPDGSKGNPEFNLTNWGSLEINVGKKYGIEIVPFGLTLGEKKEELEGDLVYKIEYIQEDPTYFIYKKSIVDSEVEPEIHFFMNIELEGDVYEIKNLNNQAYKQKAIEKMIKSAASLTSKNPA